MIVRIVAYSMPNNNYNNLSEWAWQQRYSWKMPDDAWENRSWSNPIQQVHMLPVCSISCQFQSVPIVSKPLHPSSILEKNLKCLSVHQRSSFYQLRSFIASQNWNFQSTSLYSLFFHSRAQSFLHSSLESYYNRIWIEVTEEKKIRNQQHSHSQVRYLLLQWNGELK